jgi:hypothetical protein
MNGFPVPQNSAGFEFDRAMPEPGPPEPDLPRRPREREIRYTPKISTGPNPAAWQDDDIFDGGSRVPFGGEAPVSFGAPHDVMHQGGLEGSPGYEFGPGTGPMRALAMGAAQRTVRPGQADPRQGGRRQIDPRQADPRRAGSRPGPPGPGRGSRQGPLGPGRRFQPSIEDDDEDYDLSTQQRLLREIRTALRPRGWAIKVGVPILAMIPVGIAVVLLAGANPSNGTNNQTQSSDGFPPANVATADFATTAGQAGRGLSQELVATAASQGDVVAVGDETGSLVEHTEFFLSQNAGKTWQAATISGDPPSGHTPTKIAGGPNGWVAVGPNSVWTSQNGATWTLALATGLPTQAGDTVNTVTRTANGFLAAGGNGNTPVVWTSANGSTWQRTTPNLANGEPIEEAAATGNGIVIASKTAAWRSTTGTTWTPVTIPTTGAQNTLTGIAPLGNGFVAIRPGTTDSQAIAYTSANGQTWTTSATIQTGNGAALTVHELTGSSTGAAITGSADGQLFAFITANGTTWTGTNTIATTGQESFTGAAITTGNVVVTTGTGPVANARRAPVLALIGAQGDATHVNLTGVVAHQLAVNALAANGSTQVAVGSADGFPAVWSSADGGTSWQRATGAAFNRAGVQNLTGVAHGNSGWVAVGSVVTGTTAHPVVVTSPNGTNWTTADNELAFDGAGLSATAVTGGTAGYVIVGEQNGIALSWFSKGLTGWQLEPIPDSAGATISAVVASGGTFVAVGTSGNRPVAWIRQNDGAWRATTIALPAGASSGELKFAAVNGTRLVAAGSTVTGGVSKPFAVVSNNGGDSWVDSEIVVQGKETTITALTAAGSGFTALGTKAGQDVVIWTLDTGTAWTTATPTGRGLSGAGSQELTAITAAGNELTATGFEATAATEEPTIWQSPVRG